ncbi:hypothetical protein [Acidiplasma sp.]|uniref:hypothetical protein n=1 Tax=Acidiplasma sp. TaxID=1872114 RepID=UPI0031626ADE
MKNVTSTKGSIMFYLIPSVISLGFFLYLTIFISMKLFQYIAIYFIAPIFSIIITLLVHHSIKKNIKNRSTILKFSLLVFVFSYILLESIFLIINIHTLFSIILLIPFDLIIIAIPFYINYRDKMPYNGIPGEYSTDLTTRLREVTGDEDIEVYISEFSRANLYGATTRGNDWNLIIYKSAFDKFNEPELLLYMLQIYYSKKFNINKIMLRDIFLWFVLIADMLFISYILSIDLPDKYGIYFLPLLALSVILIILTPLIINRKIIDLNNVVDKKILEKAEDMETLKSMILTLADREPLRPLPQYQYNRYKQRLLKNAYTRIKNIEKS